jgi:hypothetical protein
MGLVDNFDRKYENQKVSTQAFTFNLIEKPHTFFPEDKSNMDRDGTGQRHNTFKISPKIFLSNNCDAM